MAVNTTGVIDAVAPKKESLPTTIGRDRQKLHLTFLLFASFGGILALTNASIPITRNALCYAKAALAIVQHHFNILAIARDPAWTSGKPILFPILAAPLVWLFDANRGTVLASAIGTIFFLWTVTLALPRINRHSNLKSSQLALEFAWVASNPLVVYQFWSAYADSLFAGLVLMTFVITDAIASEPERDTRPHLALLGVTIFLAIHAKLYGAILAPASLLYLLLHRRELLSRSTHLASKSAILTLVLIGLMTIVVAAKLDVNPLLQLSPGGGYGGFSGADPFGSLGMFGFFMLLSVQTCVIFLCKKAAWCSLALGPSLFSGVYLLGLVFFDGTFYNMRYFLPILPFLAPLLAAGAESVNEKVRRATWRTYAVIAATLIAVFNLPAFERLADPMLSQASPAQNLLSWWLDNLRLPVQMHFKEQISGINLKVPPHATFYWSSDYYGTATHGLAQRLGIRRDLDIHYVLYPIQIPFPRAPVYGTVFEANAASSKMELPPAWATVRPMGDGLFRLDPIFLKMNSEPADLLAPRAPVRLRATLVTGASVKAKMSSVEFMDGQHSLGTAAEPPFELTWIPTVGRHDLTARTTYLDGEMLLSKPYVVYAGIPALERIADSAGDIAVETRDGSVVPSGDSVELGWIAETDAGYTAIYFENIPLRPGADIAKAYLDFGIASPQVEPSNLQIQAELSANATAIKFEKNDLSRRPKTRARVNWTPTSWSTVGERKLTPDLASLLREVIAHADWQPGNAIVLLIEGRGRRVAQGHGEASRGAPRLYIELR